jgi:uncharacterized membrane protein
MDFKKHLETSWHLTLRFIAPLILMTLVMVTASVFTLGILAPVTMAGYMQSILLMIRDGREPKIQDVFSQMNLFLPLLGFGLAAVIATAVGFSLMVLPGILISLAVSFCCLYVIPLMTDRKMGLIDAVKKSISMSLQGDIPEHAVVVILFIGISWIGSCVLIGWLFTQPLATIFLLLVYQERTSQMPVEGQPLKQKM